MQSSATQIRDKDGQMSEQCAQEHAILKESVVSLGPARVQHKTLHQVADAARFPLRSPPSIMSRGSYLVSMHLEAQWIASKFNWKDLPDASCLAESEGECHKIKRQSL